MEPWEKVLVDGENFPGSIHGLNGCIDCHGGVQSPDKESAHVGVVRNPSQDSEGICGQCHPNIVAAGEHSLHNNMAGYWTELDARSLPSNHPELEEMFGNHCATCHTTCGECHVSQPTNVGGGFIDGHLFNATPSMTRNCTACHGSRIGNEFLGKHEGFMADVHFRQGQMNCVDCHSGDELHGEPAGCNQCHEGPETEQVPPPDHRYAGVQAPRCETCHASVATGQDDVIFHQMHGSDLSCQVCHSISYTSCDGCHVAISEETGQAFFETDGAYLTFLIGRSPIQSYDRPYEFVPVRHVPISADSFEYYGENLLPNFDQSETWKYTTPHNIQRNTPQTESCNACHGNPDLFLTVDKVLPEELNANEDVIVEAIPLAITSAEQIP